MYSFICVKINLLFIIKWDRARKGIDEGSHRLLWIMVLFNDPTFSALRRHTIISNKGISRNEFPNLQYILYTVLYILILVKVSRGKKPTARTNG